MNRRGHGRYYLPALKIQDCKVIADGKTFSINQFKNDMRHLITFGKL